MSSAFVREGDEQSLQDISPSLNALIRFLTQENNGVRVYQIRNYLDKLGREIHEMSNGLSYFKDSNSKWQTVA
jgi:hypothetical protein